MRQKKQRQEAFNAIPVSRKLRGLIMKSKNFFAVLVLAMALPALAFGQMKEQSKPISFSQLLTHGLAAPKGLAGLLGLNPHRFSVQHSYSLSYLSAGGNGYSQGLYLNTMSYQVSDPLSVSLQWGMMNQPLGAFGAAPLYQNGFFFSGANLEYKPSDKFSVGLQISSQPRSNYYSPYYYRLGNSYYDRFRSEER
jgi:hypothetical protein